MFKKRKVELQFYFFIYFAMNSQIKNHFELAFEWN